MTITRAQLPPTPVSPGTQWEWDLSDENKIVARLRASEIVVTMPKVWTVDGPKWESPNITWCSGGFETIASTEAFSASLMAASKLAQELTQKFCNK